jgi:transposase
VPNVTPGTVDAKKKTKRAEEQKRNAVKAARQQFQEEMNALCPSDLIVLDEMGCVTGMSRAYGYAPCGARAVSYEPGRKGSRLSVIGALSLERFLGGLEVRGSVNGDVFEVFVTEILLPHVKPGKIVLLDNVPFHHREGIQELIEAQGATVKFLPPYSPEFNPIEECWSKVKAWLRKQAARTVEALQDAITEALGRITAHDIQGWFRHAGYQCQ